MSAVDMLCVCGSGQAYDTCRGRPGAQHPTVGEFQQALRRAWQHRTCMHPAAPAGCTQPIAAHSIPRSAVLSSLVGTDGHVLTFSAMHARDRGEGPWRIGWKKASTFANFCEAHDGPTFRALDEAPFRATPEQTFLIGYRALCVELHDKIGSSRSGPVVRQFVSRRQPPGDGDATQGMLESEESGTAKGLESTARLKTRMDAALVARDFSGWSRRVIWCKGAPAFASAAALTPNRDLDGRTLRDGDGRALQVLQDREARDLQNLLIGTALTDDGFAVILTWQTGRPAPAAFVESILQRPLERLPSLIVQVLLAFAANTYLAEAWWSGLKPIQRRHLARLGNVTNAYYDELVWIAAVLGPWEVMAVTD